MRAITGFIGGALSLTLALAPIAGRADDAIVKIGFAAPLTGPSAADGKEMENAARLAVEDANSRRPTLKGKAVRFELEPQDDQGDPRIASQIAQRFADIGVSGVVGHFNSTCSIAAARTYSAANIAQVSPSSTSASYTQQGYKTTFRVVGHDAVAGATLGNYLVDQLKAKRIAIIDDQTDFGRGLADRVEATLRERHANVVAHEYVTDKTIDFSAVLTKLRAKNPDVIVFGGFDAQAAQVVRRMRSLGLTATLVGEGFNNEIFLDLAKGEGEGSLAVQPGIPFSQMPGTDFVNRYRTRFGTSLKGFQGPYAYDAASVIIEAVLKAQSKDPAKVLAAVADSSIKGATGPIAFDARGDLASAPYTLYKLEGKDWRDIDVIRAKQ
ncbi:extracellular ligand-binding receptor [Caballeronia turbans]|nr:extracellular ligand-binding receptor [Caballeronia turbans]